MGNDEFVAWCKKMVVDYHNGIADSTDKNGKITEAEVFVVWCCKALQNCKALLSTTVPDGMYYEITYNGNKEEAYFDAYKKWKNFAVQRCERGG